MSIPTSQPLTTRSDGHHQEQTYLLQEQNHIMHTFSMM